MMGVGFYDVRLADLVKDAFDSAHSNGYVFGDATDEEVARDMIDCDSDIAEYANDKNGELDGYCWQALVQMVRILRPR